VRVTGWKRYDVDGRTVDIEFVEYDHPITLIGQRIKGWQYANEENETWQRSYIVSFDDHTNYGILVNADNESDALDVAADFAEEMGWEGYFVDDSDDDEDEDDETYEFVGSYDRRVRSEEIKIFEVETPPPAKRRVTYSGGRPVRNPQSNLPQDVIAAFTELGYAQRGDPEEAMRRAQAAMGGGVMSVLIEHVGDLTHRMSHKALYDYDGYSEVHEKLDQTIYSLHDEYSFAHEAFENFRSNARYHGVLFETYWANIQQALAVYVAAHKALPAYNEAQWLAREAAIEVGEMHFVLAKKYLVRLQHMQKTRSMWHRAAFAYKRGPGGGLLVSHWPEDMVHALRRG